MDSKTKQYIDSLTVESVPWHRMITAYGTAKNYPELFTALENARDKEEWEKVLRALSDFEHQSTMLPPAPFALVFLVRHFERLLEAKSETAARLLDIFMYYALVCADAETYLDKVRLERLSDMLLEENLLPDGITDEQLDEYFEAPEMMYEKLEYSCYFYSEKVLSLIPEMLDKYEEFKEEGRKLKEIVKAFAAG